MADESRILRLRQGDVGRELDRLNAGRDVGGAGYELVQIVREVSVPTAVEKYFAARSATVDGTEGENQAASFAVSGDIFYVALIGTEVPSEGDYLLAAPIGGRWVAGDARSGKVGNCTNKLPRVLNCTSAAYGDWPTIEYDDDLGTWRGCKVITWPGGVFGTPSGNITCPPTPTAIWWQMKCGVIAPGIPALQMLYTRPPPFGCMPTSSCATEPDTAIVYSGAATLQWTPYFRAQFDMGFSNIYLPPAGYVGTSDVVTVEEPH